MAFKIKVLVALLLIAVLATIAHSVGDSRADYAFLLHDKCPRSHDHEFVMNSIKTLIENSSADMSSPGDGNYY
ncbi:hypothetical protein PanWU01x14_370580 [Parasponia andersonii]|uniref:Transmembrane protein n=1 Tax=Parasponia andersonii TaxID=3476 RepID=A0A2P5A475_PARAD|nr:hypothetical protein PanWU01x14_370580 [Parasponia andersonii]